jgi:hypothetical protein
MYGSLNHNKIKIYLSTLKSQGICVKNAACLRSFLRAFIQQTHFEGLMCTTPLLGTGVTQTEKSHALLGLTL